MNILHKETVTKMLLILVTIVLCTHKIPNLHEALLQALHNNWSGQVDRESYFFPNQITLIMDRLVGWDYKICQLYFCRGIRSHPPNKCPGYDTELHLMVRLQSWSFGECGVLLHCHYSQVHSLEMVVLVRVRSMGQIEMFNHFTVSKQMTDVKLNC